MDNSVRRRADKVMIYISYLCFGDAGQPAWYFRERTVVTPGIRPGPRICLIDGARLRYCRAKNRHQTTAGDACLKSMVQALRHVIAGLQ